MIEKMVSGNEDLMPHEAQLVDAAMRAANEFPKDSVLHTVKALSTVLQDKSVSADSRVRMLEQTHVQGADFDLNRATRAVAREKLDGTTRPLSVSALREVRRSEFISKSRKRLARLASSAIVRQPPYFPPAKAHHGHNR